MVGTFFKMGDYNVICDRTGFKIKASTSKKEWNAARVRERSWEARQPQDKLRGVPDNQSVEDPRPESPDVFVGTNQIKPEDL